GPHVPLSPGQPYPITPIPAGHLQTLLTEITSLKNQVVPISTPMIGRELTSLWTANWTASFTLTRLTQDRPTHHRRVRQDQHLSRDWFRKTIWYPALRQAARTHPVRIQDLRHTNASWMLAGGADLETIRERLGHHSLRATERYLNPRELHQMGEKLQVTC
ncbi:tyrosine-type recombinase/integrase, partial [Saccharopolyspora sp. NPDC000995]